MNNSRESIREALVNHFLRIALLTPSFLDHSLQWYFCELWIALRMARLTPFRANNSWTYTKWDFLANLFVRINSRESKLFALANCGPTKPQTRPKLSNPSSRIRLNHQNRGRGSEANKSRHSPTPASSGTSCGTPTSRLTLWARFLGTLIVEVWGVMKLIGWVLIVIILKHRCFQKVWCEHSEVPSRVACGSGSCAV